MASEISFQPIHSQIKDGRKQNLQHSAVLTQNRKDNVTTWYSKTLESRIADERMRCLLFIVIMLVSWGEGSGAEGEAMRADARSLMDLRLADATGVDRAAYRQAVQSALGADFITSCKCSMTAAQVSCMLNVTDSAMATVCSASSSR